MSVKSTYMFKIGSPLILLAIFLAFSVGAFVIAGWIHPDEHYQILEFANYKRGLIESKYLTWEFQDRVRPAIQPATAFILLEFLEFIKISDPFSQTLLLRLVSVALFILCSYRLFSALREDFTSLFFQRLFFFVTFLVYIFPLSGGRFTSENWSSCLYIIGFAGLYPFIKSKPVGAINSKQALLTGLIFGLSFLFRYQSAIMVFGLALWLLIFQLQQLRYWLVMLSGFLVAVGIGVVIDYWFYGDWVLSAANYFQVNLIEGVAATFGVEPWWWYLEELASSRAMILLNGSYVLLVLVFLVTKFKHPVTWIFFPFLVIHFFIGHKEMRFIYPVLVFLPYMFTSSFQFIDNKIRKRRLLWIALLPLTLLNGFAFIATSLRAQDNSTEIFKFISTLPDKPVCIYYDGDNFYYTLFEKTHTPKFYKDQHLIVARRKQPGFVDSTSNLRVSSDTLTYVILDYEEQAKVKGRAKPIFTPQPEFVSAINYRNWMRLGFARWKIYSLNKSEPEL